MYFLVILNARYIHPSPLSNKVDKTDKLPFTSRLIQGVVTRDSQTTRRGKRKGVKVLFACITQKEQKTLKVLDLNLQPHNLVHAWMPLRKAPQHVPQSLQPSRDQRPLRGWVERLVPSSPSHLSLARGEFMKDATRDEASQGPGRKRQTGCLGVEQSYPEVVVPKPASSMRTEVGFNNLYSQVLSQRF